MLRNNFVKFGLRSVKFNNLGLKLFNTPATNTANQQVVTPPQKTKEEIKVETLLQQWPDALRKPKILELEALKDFLETTYKYYGEKKYIGGYDIPAPILTEVELKVNHVRTTDAIAEFFKEYQGFIPEKFIMNRFHQIALTHKDKTPEFFNDILPEVKKLVINSDRHTPQNLFIAVESGSLLGLEDKEFWDMIEFKLVNERLYRYLKLEHAARVALHLVISGHGNRTLLQHLEVYFIKHRRALHLDKKLLNWVTHAYSICGASPTLFAALEDPNIEVPGIDGNIPKMERLGPKKSHPEILPVNENKKLKSLH